MVICRDKLKIGTSAPSFYLKTLDNSDFFLTDHCGTPRQPWKNLPRKPVVVSFFATYCIPCRKEIPELEKLAYHYGESVSFVLVDLQEDKLMVEKYVRENRIKLAVLLDRFGVTAKKYKVESLPSLFVIDSKGQLAFVQYGFEEGFEEKLTAVVNSCLNTAAE